MICPIPDVERAIHLPFNQKLEHGLVSYYNEERVSSLNFNPLFAKRNLPSYLSQVEYRHVFFIDYCQFTANNKITPVKEKNNNDMQIIKEVKITLPLGAMHSLTSYVL